MKLTKVQKEAILRATQEQDYCGIAHKRTMQCLWDKCLAVPSSGFGYKYGAIFQLTDEGKKIHLKLKANEN